MAGPAPDDSFWWGPAFQILMGLRQDEITKPMEQHPWVFRAISVLVDALTSVPLLVQSGDEDNPTTVESGPWVEFLNDPHPELSPGMFWALTWMYQLERPGECFWILDDGDLGENQRPRFAYPTSGKFWEVWKDEKTNKLKGWKFQPGSSDEREFEPHQVVQFRYLPNLYSPRRGLAPLDAAFRSVRSDHKAQVWNESSLDNGAQPGGILSSRDNGAGLTTEQAKTLKRQFEDRHKGAGNARRLAVLPGGLQYTQTGMTPKDMEFESQRKWSRQEVASAYGVPLMLLSDASDIHSKESAKTQLMLFWENAVIPLFERTSETLSHGLIRGLDDVWMHWDTSNVKALQRDDTEKRAAAASDWAMGVPFQSLNERHELGYDKIEHGEKGFVPISVEPIEQAVAEPMPLDDFNAPPEAPADSALSGLEGTEGTQDVDVLEDLVLNGAQIQAALQIVLSVTAGDLPRDSGLGMLAVLFNLTPEQAEAIMGSAGTDIETTPNPKPEGSGTPPPEQEEEEEAGDDRSPHRPTSQRSSESPRLLMWKEYIRGIQHPGEKRMKGAVLKWIRRIRKDLMRWTGGERGDRQLDEGNVNAWLAEQQEKWARWIVNSTQPITERIVELSLKRVEEQIGGFTNVSPTHPAILELIEEMGGRKIKLPETIVKHVKNQLLEGIAGGENITQLQDRVIGVTKTAASRSLAIARTESGAASTGARYRAYKEEGITQHQWITAGDENVRDSHQAQDGMIREIGEEFPNGLRFPLDPLGSASEVINCRCDTAPVIES